MRISKARLKQIILEEYKKVLAEAHGLDAGDVKTLKKHVKKLQKEKEDKAVQKILKFLLKSNVKVKKTQDVTKMKKKKKTVSEMNNPSLGFSIANEEEKIQDALRKAIFKALKADPVKMKLLVRANKQQAGKSRQIVDKLIVQASNKARKMPQKFFTMEDIQKIALNIINASNDLRPSSHKNMPRRAPVKVKKTVKEQLRDTRDVNVVAARPLDDRSAEEEADDIMRAQFGPDIDKMKKYDDGGQTEKDQEEAERMPLIRKKNRNVGLKGPTELNARAKKVAQSLEQFVYTMYRTQRIMGDDLTKEQARAFKVLEKQINEVGYRIRRLVNQFKD